MRRLFRSPQTVVAALLGVILALLSLGPVAASPPLVIVNGGGPATLTDPDGYEYPLTFSLSARLSEDGSASGYVTFVFRDEFSAVWGAVPGVTLIHLSGQVTEVIAAPDGTVTIRGTLTEKDYSQGQGVVFVEENVPFEIVTGGALGTSTFMFQWCLLPVFPVDTDRPLHIH